MNNDAKYCVARLINYLTSCRWRLLAIFSLLMSLVIALGSSAQAADNERLAKVKAAYVYNVLKFTRWPETDMSASNVIRVGIVGQDTVAAFLMQGFNGRQAQDRSIEVLKIDYDELGRNESELWSKLKSCQLVYLSQSLVNNKAHIIAKMKGSNTLLVGGSEDFIGQGGMVGILFDKQRKRVKFIVNMEVLRESPISISSKLLKFADLVGD